MENVKEKYYIHIQEIKPKNFIYGIMSVVEDSPFDYEVSKMVGDRETILENISKKIIKDNEINFNQNKFIFKYDSLNDAKIMENKFLNDDYYKDYSIEASPALFSSDIEKVDILKSIVKRNALQEQIIEKNKYGFFKQNS